MNKLTRIILYLFIFTVPFQQSLMIPGIGSLNKLFSIALIGIAILTVIYNGKIKKTPFIFLILFIFLCLNVASIFWGVSTSDGIVKLILYTQLFFVFWIIYEFIDTEERLHISLKSFVLGCIVVAMLSLQAYLTGGQAVQSVSRFVLDGYNPNALGILWVFGMVMSAYLFFNVSRKYFLFIPLATFLILLTGSRTALLLALFVAAVTMWYMYRHKLKYRKTITLILIFFSILIYNQIPQAQLDRLGTIDEQFASGDLNGRVAIFESGIRAFNENPILGVGAGSFQEVSVLYSNSSMEMSSHNSYLTILVENGILGFIIFSLFLVGLFITAWKTQGSKNLRWLSLVLIALWLILSLVSHAEAQKYTWIIFGIIVSTYWVSKNIYSSKYRQHLEK